MGSSVTLTKTWLSDSLAIVGVHGPVLDHQFCVVIVIFELEHLKHTYKHKQNPCSALTTTIRRMWLYTSSPNLPVTAMGLLSSVRTRLPPAPPPPPALSCHSNANTYTDRGVSRTAREYQR